MLLPSEEDDKGPDVFPQPLTIFSCHLRDPVQSPPPLSAACSVMSVLEQRAFGTERGLRGPPAWILWSPACVPHSPETRELPGRLKQTPRELAVMSYSEQAQST